jgi:hypothetical protein
VEVTVAAVLPGSSIGTAGPARSGPVAAGERPDSPVAVRRTGLLVCLLLPGSRIVPGSPAGEGLQPGRLPAPRSPPCCRQGPAHSGSSWEPLRARRTAGARYRGVDERAAGAGRACESQRVRSDMSSMCLLQSSRASRPARPVRLPRLYPPPLQFHSSESPASRHPPPESITQGQMSSSKTSQGIHYRLWVPH